MVLWCGAIRVQTSSVILLVHVFMFLRGRIVSEVNGASEVTSSGSIITSDLTLLIFSEFKIRVYCLISAVLG